MEIEDISNIVLDDDEASFEVVEEEEKSIELPEDIKNLQIIELRERLIKAGFPPGPVTITTQSMYKKKLFIQEMKNFKEYGVRENLLPFEN
uniref:LEM domain-containing protein n=1 Tax=Panagrolaimus superbus TaxID=310955 RepID=A0A914YVL0_9BILA